MISNKHGSFDKKDNNGTNKWQKIKTTPNILIAGYSCSRVGMRHAKVYRLTYHTREEIS